MPAIIFVGVNPNDTFQIRIGVKHNIWALPQKHRRDLESEVNQTFFLIQTF